MNSSCFWQRISQAEFCTYIGIYCMMCSGRVLLRLVRIENKTRSALCVCASVLNSNRSTSFAVTSAAAASRNSRVSLAVVEVLLQTFRDDAIPYNRHIWLVNNCRTKNNYFSRLFAIDIIRITHTRIKHVSSNVRRYAIYLMLRSRW